MRAEAALLLLLLAGPLEGGEAALILLPAAQASLAWSAVDADPRSAAMAGAVAAAPSPGFALKGNPAGLAQVFDSQLAFAHNEWLPALGMRQEYFSFARRMGEENGLGLGLEYFSLGPFEDRDEAGAPLGGGSDAAYALSLGYARAIDEDLHLGFSLQAAQESLGSRVQGGSSAGLGALYRVLPWLRLGFHASQLGLGLEQMSPPAALKLGAALHPLGRALLLSAQLDRPQHGPPALRLGAEWSLLGLYHLRGGWRFSPEEGEADQGPSLGAGLRLGALNLDYAYAPYGQLSRVHRVAATLEVSEGLFNRSIVIESYGATQAAQAEFAAGQAAYLQGDWPAAKVSLSRALKAGAALPKAAQARQMLEEIGRRLAEEKSQGLTPQLKEKLEARVRGARELMDDGHFDRARRALEAALEWDAGFPPAAEAMQELERRVAEKAERLRQEAFAALAQGDLAAGVRQYRAVLEVDRGDGEANARLAKLRPRILAEAKRLHRQGIDHYLGSEIDKAVAVWEKALELDPSDPHKIRRDLEKARRLLELRGGK